ncbi:MAG: integrase core domain-containing protein [Spirochaetales bacterium]|nr:integrase core domain-containing protein [Spirochaetales bacterium]
MTLRIFFTYFTVRIKPEWVSFFAGICIRRVSDDNAYSESLFKTLKYTAGFPKYFTDLGHSRSWIADFVDWYNNKHRHSGIGYVTPNQRHSGESNMIMQKRNETIAKAYALNPAIH